jgi:hypothetical protein
MIFNFLRLNFSKPGPLQVASRMLAETELNRLAATAEVEYWQASEKMYRDRTQRLRSEIKIMTEDTEGTRSLAKRA